MSTNANGGAQIQGKREGKLNFPPTLITLSLLHGTLVLSCRNSESKFVKDAPSSSV